MQRLQPVLICDAWHWSAFYVTFHGVESHAAMSPHKGKSAFDAALLSFQAIEFMREHVLEDSRMHYTILDAGGPSQLLFRDGQKQSIHCVLTAPIIWKM